MTSKLYDIDVPGYKMERKNRLRLFDLGSVDDNIIYDGIEFDKEDIFRNLTLFLYPDDSTDEGKVLRIFQQYFMVSNAAQLLIDEAVAKDQTYMTYLIMPLFKSTILTHHLLFQN